LNAGGNAIDDASHQVAQVAGKIDALRGSAWQAAGTGDDGKEFIKYFSQAIDAAVQGVKGIVDGLTAAKENLQATQKLLEGTNDVNNANVPKLDSSGGQQASSSYVDASAPMQSRSSQRALTGLTPRGQLHQGEAYQESPGTSSGPASPAVPATPRILAMQVDSAPATPAGQAEPVTPAVPEAPRMPVHRVAKSAVPSKHAGSRKR